MDKPFGTPHRRSNSASSLTAAHFPIDQQNLPLDHVLADGPHNMLEELSDGMATLDMNLQRLNYVHNSLSQFNESFSAFVHCIKMNAWCVEFTEAPTLESFQHDRDDEAAEEPSPSNRVPAEHDFSDTTFMTTIVAPVLPPTMVEKTPQRFRTAPSASRIPASQSTKSRIPKPSPVPWR